MKNFYYSFLLVMVMTSLLYPVKSIHAQQIDNYYTIRDAWDTYFGSHSDTSGDEDGDYEQFLRWKAFWRYKTDNADSTKIGSMATIRDAYIQYYQSIQNTPGNSNFSPWNYCGPTNMKDQVNALVSAIYVDTLSDNNFKVIYIGTDASGIWKTIDGGLNWTNVTDASGLYCIGITKLIGDPTNSNIIYATTGGGGIDYATGWGIGLIQSTDAGATWNQIYPLTPQQKVLSQYVVMDPTDHKRLYVGVGGKVIRLENNNGTWSTSTIYQDLNDNIRTIRDIELKPDDPSVLYVATDDRSNSNRHRPYVFKIMGANASSQTYQFFHPFCDSLYSERYEVAVSPLSPNSIYVIGTVFYNDGAPYNLTIWKSDNNGQTWHLKFLQDQTAYTGLNLAGGGQVAYSKMEMQISPTDTTILYVGGNTISQVKQTSGNWQIKRTTPYNYGWKGSYHPDTRETIILKGSSPIDNGENDILVCGNDGGISITKNGINSWQNLNGTGLWANEFWGIGGTDQSSEWIGGGTTHNATFINTDNKWSQIEGGDAARLLTDFQEPSVFYVNHTIDYWVTTELYNYGKSDKPDDIRNVLNANGETPIWNMPLALSPMNTNILFIAARNLYRNNHIKVTPSTTFTKIPVQLGGGSQIDDSEKINCIAISESDTNTMFLSFENPYGTSDSNFQHKFLKVHQSNGVYTFTDLLASNPNLYNCLSWATITSIVVSPTESNKIWVSISGFSGSSDHNKVFFSQDGGNQFLDVSTGLPDFPVNCMTYWRGTSDRLFLGTDIGVFYKDGNNPWQPFNQGLPVTMVTDLIVLPESEILRAATYGRGIWETWLHSCTPDINPRVVTTDETWTTPINMDRSIFVKAPAKLTIKTTVKFMGMTKIMVEPGATLICDTSCDLTTYCSDMWLGIEVWGNSNLEQTPVNQGVVYFLNGATVENSRIGITTCKKDNNGNIDWSSTGGIIHAINARFRNNFKAVELLTYPYMQHTMFKNVTFETTGFFADHLSNPQTFVSMLEVKNIGFEACEFINRLSDTTQPVTQVAGDGITSIGSQFTVTGLCQGSIYPCSKWTPSVFKGLYYGIHAIETMSVNVVLIDKSRFAGNEKSVYLCGTNNSQVTSSEFKLIKSKSSLTFADTIYGLYLNFCTGYKIQENKFWKEHNQPVNVLQSFIGLVINNSGSNPNQVYNNSFLELGIGILSQNINRSRDGRTGLCLKCNDYDVTYYDQAVTQDAGLSIPYGIAQQQGSYDPQHPDVTSPAGNTFSSNHKANLAQGISDINNKGGPITYYYHVSFPNTLRIFPDWTTSNVTKIPANVGTYHKEAACPSLLNSGGGSPDQIKLNLLYADIQADSLKTKLIALVDGGNTDLTNSDIFFSTPPDAMQLHDDLMEKSPYLSDTVMKSSIDKEDVLPNAMIRDILVANPQSAKSDNIMNELDTRVDPMPEEMMDDILAGKDTIGSKEQLEGNLFDSQLWQSYYLSELIRSYSLDTSINGTDSIINLLQHHNDIESKYLLAFEYLSEGQTDRVTEVLNGIPNQFQLSDEQVKEYQNYSTYMGILNDLRSQNHTILEITSVQINQLQQLLNEATDPVQTYARNILLANKLIEYTEPIILPNEDKSVYAGKGTNPSVKSVFNSVKLFPNPANQFIIAQYDCSAQIYSKDILTITVVFSDGKIALSKELKKSSDQVVIDCRNLRAGTYICKISSSKKILGSGKFVIAK